MLSSRILRVAVTRTPRRHLLRQFNTKAAGLLNHDTNSSSILSKLQPPTVSTPTKVKPVNGHELDTESPLIYENELIRKVFDDETYWGNFSRDPNSAIQFLKNFNKETGLFLNPYLTSPSGLRSFSKDSLAKAQTLTNQIVHDRSEQGLLNYITNLDRLSDILCRVIDLAEFVRISHPNKSFLKAAQQCHEEMFEFMNVLNTNVDLYLNLKHVLTDPKIFSRLSEEEIKVGNILLSDFEKSGINMNDETRNDFIALSQEISVVSQRFTSGVGEPAISEIVLSKEELSGVDQSVLSSLKQVSRGLYAVPAYGHLPYQLLLVCSNEQTRKSLWALVHSTHSKQVEDLDYLLKLRYALANLLGKPSYAAYQLDEKMAKNPENVKEFLLRLQTQIKPHAIKELRSLAELKQKEIGDTTELTDEQVADFLKPWDRDYYSNIYSTMKRRSNSQQISSYFSLGVVMQGLSNLFSKIYGIQLIPTRSLNGETWNDDVRKLQVVSETEGLVGVVYCDLFQRSGKTPNPAHFTICCSKKIYPEEDNPVDLKLIQTRVAENGEKFQLPVISLVCNFEKNQNIGRCLLTLNEVETLFHEMGHAMHSMLGRTALHNVSGTRCVTDFVELPSILMEHFANDPRVIQTFARHYLTDEPIPLALLENFQKENNLLKFNESYSQIKMSLLDQALHSEYVGSPDFNSTDVYHHEEKKSQLFSDGISNWQGKFGHLSGYGASYYSYILDRAIASKVWTSLFEKDPLNRVNGEFYKESILKWGGSRDSWECVADALKLPQLKKGDENAMDIIGETEI
ncbi:hypothetical protein WICPIJ_010099 [Wickerhamomyces pijperi]|uniref:Mitochondrial intermediate peptidase n=1 Tax=Wickerhamomyces pijperi TaxID=599730 RepID=A0A9P8PH31_WICPI|nr:hypothetical protein WICPIJ_010099 [Wickerhamomyces pijperi]